VIICSTADGSLSLRHPSIEIRLFHHYADQAHHLHPLVSEVSDYSLSGSKSAGISVSSACSTQVSAELSLGYNISHHKGISSHRSLHHYLFFTASCPVSSGSRKSVRCQNSNLLVLNRKSSACPVGRNLRAFLSQNSEHQKKRSAPLAKSPMGNKYEN